MFEPALDRARHALVPFLHDALCAAIDMVQRNRGLPVRIGHACGIKADQPRHIGRSAGIIGDAFGRAIGKGHAARLASRSEEHTSELQSLMRISYAVFCLKKKTTTYANQKDLNVG